MSATLQQLIAWLLFAVVLYAVGAVVSKSKVRFWDVAAFNLFARIPFDLSLLMFAIPSVRSIMGLITDGSFETAMQYMNLLMVVGLVSMLFSIWYFFWSYKAFAEPPVSTTTSLCWYNSSNLAMTSASYWAAL